MSPNNKKFRNKLVALLAIGLAGVGLSIFIQMHEPALEPQVIAPKTPPADFAQTKAKAEAGDAVAQNLLGDMYLKGLGAAQNYNEAAHWYGLASEQGDSNAQEHLGELYEAGRGVPRDEQQAAQWYRRSAESGNPLGQYALAVLYVTGRGVNMDDAEAVRWYRLSAERGYDLAQYNLGERSVAGKSMPQDNVEAYKWFLLAEAQGLPDATVSMEKLKAKMTSAQIKEAKQRAAVFSVTKGPVGKR